MATDLPVVSLGRVLADDVRVEPDEAHAVLQHVWQYLRTNRANDGGVPHVPALDAIGVTAFGDFQVRSAAGSKVRVVRPPHLVARELARVLVQLVGSGRESPEGGAASCVAVAQRALTAQPSSGARPITAPEALLVALEAFRPRDGSAALAALYARWMRTTDSGRMRPSANAAATGALALGIGAPKAALAAARARTDDTAGAAASPRLLLAATPPARAASQKPRPSVGNTSQPPAGVRPPEDAAPAAPAPEPAFTPAVSGLRRPGRLGFAFRFGTAALVVGLAGAALAWRSDLAVRLTDLTGLQPAVAAPPPAETRERPAGTGRVGGRPHTDVELEPTSLRRIAHTPPRARRVLRAEAPGGAPYSPSFDPQTHALVFHAGRDRTALREAALDADGTVAGTSTVRADGSRSYHAQVSPDGSRLAFDSDVDGPRGVYIANRDGSEARRVSGPGHASVPSWSPDGEYLAFARAEPSRPRVWNLWTLHVATGRLERRTSHRVGQPWGASWFPDGRRLAYSLEGELIVRDLQSGAVQTYSSPVQGRLVRTPAVSPDGRRIVFQVRHDGAWVLDLESGTPSRILADASAEEFAWSPDGRRVAYHSLRGGEWGIWLLDLAP